LAKRLHGEEIDNAILKYLTDLPFSATTEMVAKQLNVAWYTAQMHLFKLEQDRKVRYFKIGRQNQWIISSKMTK
jgi:hypothetical protein